MTDQTLPPLLTTKMWPGRGGPWYYDTLGRHGRPVILIPAILFERTIWWPTAADLRPYATVLTVDLPGHGHSPRRTHYQPDELVDELAELIAHLDLRRAPVIVAHGSSTGLAVRFTHRYAVHAVVTIDPYLETPTDRATYLRDVGADTVPGPYRHLVTAVDDPHLLDDYRPCLAPWPTDDTAPAPRHTRLAVHSRPPSAQIIQALPGWRHETYQVPGKFAHLTDGDRFTRDLRSLL